jgi:hypothetical protein
MLSKYHLFHLAYDALITDAGAMKRFLQKGGKNTTSTKIVERTMMAATTSMQVTTQMGAVMSL